MRRAGRSWVGWGEGWGVGCEVRQTGQGAWWGGAGQGEVGGWGGAGWCWAERGELRWAGEVAQAGWGGAGW